jgi:hypothetical protein
MDGNPEDGWFEVIHNAMQQCEIATNTISSSFLIHFGSAVGNRLFVYILWLNANTMTLAPGRIWGR